MEISSIAKASKTQARTQIIVNKIATFKKKNSLRHKSIKKKEEDISTKLLLVPVNK